MPPTQEISTSTSTGKGATFAYVLGAFAVFAVLLALLQAWQGGEPTDPRADVRTANTAEIRKAQNELIDKMGISDKAKAAALFSKTAEALKTKSPAASKTVIPGSPTQLKMAPPAPPAAIPVAPAAAVPAAAPKAK